MESKNARTEAPLEADAVFRSLPRFVRWIWEKYRAAGAVYGDNRPGLQRWLAGKVE